MAATMEAYMADCKKDPDLQSYDDKCRARFDAVLKAMHGDGRKGIQVDSLKEVISYVKDMNKHIADAVIEAKNDMIEWLAGEEEFCKIVEQYFSTSSEMLGFCCELDRFVVSARKSHAYITHVIQKLQKETIDDDGSTTDKADQDKKSRNRYREIVEELKNLQGSAFVKSSNQTVESLYKSIKCLEKKFKDVYEASKEFNIKLNEEIEAVNHKRRVISMIFVGAAICVVALSAFAVAAVIVGASFAAWAGTTALAVSGGVGLTVLVPALAVGAAIAGKEEYDKKTMQKQEVVELLRAGATVAIKELGDIKSRIDSLVVTIESMVESGEFGMDEKEKYGVGFAWQAINNELGDFLEKIEALEEESKNCESEIRKARDDVLEGIINKAKEFKKGN